MSLIVFFLLISLLEGSTALSEGEKIALSDLLKEWPFLGSLSPAWTSNSSEACIGPFKGISCSNGPDQHILSLDLDADSESGGLPETIGDLFWLESLNLNLKNLKGSLPASLGNLTNLQTLAVRISSTWKHLVPASLSKLENLTRLTFSFGGYPGGFPEGILKMRKLKRLSLGHFARTARVKSFYGSIPASFCDLDQLMDINFASVALSGLEICSGKLPNLEALIFDWAPNMSLPLKSLLAGRPMLKILQMSSTNVYGPLELEGQLGLEHLAIIGTGISGTLPQSLFNNLNLVEIFIQSSKIGGTLPTSIGQLRLLERFFNRDTFLSGTIPPEIGLCNSLSSIDVSQTRITGTIPSEMGNLSHLTYLSFASTSIVGAIPDSFNQLSSLIEISMDDCSIEGTIPHGLLSLPHLTTFTAARSLLTGTIPDEISPVCILLILNSNFLQGSIPSSALKYCQTVYISQNLLSGQIESLTLDANLYDLKLSGNDFSGSLPYISSSSPYLNLDLSSNRFSGTIPEHYRTLSISEIDLTDNQLEGEISAITENQNLLQAKLGYNHFSGSIPNSISTSSLNTLLLSNNQLTGTIPLLPPMLETLEASGNLLSGTVDNIFKPQGPSALSHLDLSHNLLDGNPPPISSLQPFTFVSLASNNLNGYISEFGSPGTLEKLRVLDLSNNCLLGRFPFISFVNSITNLLLANNSFIGSILELSMFDQLSILDISNNQFLFEASSLGSNPLISMISAQNNRIFGTMSLIGFQSLKYSDFSGNNITGLNFDSILKLSQTASLTSLSLKNNPIIEPIAVYEQLTSDGTLTLSSTSTPSVDHPGVVCAQLLIGNNDKTQFDYDESMFSYQQCQCDRDHFGLPPSNCQSCDTLKPGSTLCNGNLVHIEQNYFVYNDSKNLCTEMCVSQFLYSIELNQGPSRISNCLGLKIMFIPNSVNMSKWASVDSHVFKQDFSTSNFQYSLQCQVGSSGRLCSRCDCDVASTDRTCYYPGPAGICKKCEKFFSPREFIPISLAALIVLVIVLSIIFYFSLASKRRSKETEWKDLSIGARLVYCLLDLTSFGQITILVTFVQILVELTHWDVYVLSSWLRVVNGESEGLGLRCLYPFLSNPTVFLLLRLLLPVMVVLIACTSIGLAELVHRFRSSLKRTSGSVFQTENDSENDSLAQTTFLINDQEAEANSVRYPSMAMITSISISIIRFFYFGTTMAAVEFLFYSVQRGTNKKFVQSVPWIEFEDAKTLRTISIPFVIVFLLGIPFGFIVMSWKLRHKISSPFVRLYFGSLFENYQSHLFWWELVNMLRKLVVALLLRGLSPGDSFQPLFITFVLGSIGVINATLKPWRRGIENFLDGIGSALLILSMASDLLGSLSHSRESRLIILVLDGIYIAFCLILIVWRTIRSETSYEKEWKLKYGPRSHQSIESSSEEYGPPLLNSNAMVLNDTTHSNEDAISASVCVLDVSPGDTPDAILR